MLLVREDRPSIEYQHDVESRATLIDRNVHTSWLGERLRLRLMAKLAHIGGQVLKSAGKIRSCRMSFTINLMFPPQFFEYFTPNIFDCRFSRDTRFCEHFSDLSPTRILPLFVELSHD
jgi:hypothetical protein